MHPDILRSYLTRVPFIPFRIVMTGGTWFDVRLPQMVSVTRQAVEIGMPIESGVQRFVTIALVHVTSVEILMPVSAL